MSKTAQVYLSYGSSASVILMICLLNPIMGSLAASCLLCVLIMSMGYIFGGLSGGGYDENSAIKGAVSFPIYMLSGVDLM